MSRDQDEHGSCRAECDQERNAEDVPAPTLLRCHQTAQRRTSASWFFLLMAGRRCYSNGGCSTRKCSSNAGGERALAGWARQSGVGNAGQRCRRLWKLLAASVQSRMLSRSALGLGRSPKGVSRLLGHGSEAGNAASLRGHRRPVDVRRSNRCEREAPARGRGVTRPRANPRRTSAVTHGRLHCR
jgi:hypothetical protein